MGFAFHAIGCDAGAALLKLGLHKAGDVTKAINIRKVIQELQGGIPS